MNTGRHPIPTRALRRLAPFATALGLALLAARASGATAYYVNDGSVSNDLWCSAVGSVTNNGLSPATPKATIQSVLDAYQPGIGATIYVDAGTYMLTNNLVLPDTGPGGGGTSTNYFRLIGAGSRTLIDRQNPQNSSVCLRICQDFAWVEGIVFRGARTGIVIDPATCRNAVLANNVLTANSGAAIHVLNDPADEGTDQYVIRNNLLFGNGAGMNLQADSGYRRASFTVENNTVDVYRGMGIAVGGSNQGTTLRNNILAVKGKPGWCLSVDRAGALAVSDYNNFFAYGGAGVVRWVTDGAHVTNQTLSAWQTASGLDGFSMGRDPLFVSPSAGNYHLRSVGGSWRNGAWVADTATSPCVDAGDPSSPFDCEPSPNGARVNLGAYGNTPEASRSAPVRKLALLAPRGGETWSGSLTLTWSASGSGWLSSDTVRIEYALSDGYWTVLANASSLPPTGSFTWTVPNPAAGATAYTLRVVCNQDAAVYAALATPVTLTRTPVFYYLNDDSPVGDAYCTATGATNHTGKSPDQPLPSLDALLSHVTLGPGDTVYWDAGTYLLTSNCVITADHKGTADTPLLITGVPNGTKLVRDANGANRRCLEVHADHIRIEALTAAGAEIGISVNATTARNVRLVGNTCSNNVAGGIEVKPYGAAANGEFQILQNVVVANGGAGLFLQGSSDPGMTDGKAVFIVENNTVSAGGVGIKLLNTTATGRRLNFFKNNIIAATNSQAVCLVARPGSVHYSDFNNLCAPAGGFVAAWQDATNGFVRFATLSAWRAASGQDKNSISTNALFSAPQSGNYRLGPASPCVDAGVVSFWMFGAADADTNPRLAGRSADMGAYELNLRSSVRLFLQGPFLSGTDQMRTLLGQNGLIPLTSPYADDPRTVAAIPANVTDWVLLQFRESPDGPAVLSRSVFLSRNGWLVNDAGAPTLDVNLPSGAAYYAVVKHRTHLAAMSAAPVPFADGALTYDFTEASSAFFGGTVACAAVTGASGTRWALVAGDSDGDGAVTTLDRNVWPSQDGAAGYRRGDTGLDGMVTATDNAVIGIGLGRASPVPRAETWLMPALRLTPSRQTVGAGDTLVLRGSLPNTAAFASESQSITGELSSGAPLVFNWDFARNESGATLCTNGGPQAAYTAGTATNRTDVVQAWANNDALGRAVLNVIGADTAVTAGKALVIAGRTSVNDVLWPTTDYLADTAYTTLRYRGFSKENIHYLSPVPDQDVDGNGQLDDIDGEATFAETAYAFTNSAAGADRLFVYLVDHGGKSSGSGYFRLSATETVTAAQLDAWLDALQDAHQTDVTVLLDFCYAGSFLPALTYTGAASRIVIAACGADEPTYFVAGGLVSFSSAFFSGVMLGYDVMASFTMAKEAMSSYQSGLLDDDKDGLHTAADGTRATGYYIGPTYVAAGDAPQIGEVCGNQVLTEETAATLWIGSVSSVHPITRAWCLIIPPGHNPNPDNPVTDLPAIELTYSAADGRYAATYDNFNAAGTYNCTFYVQDEAGNVSVPRHAYIAQIGYDDRVILVAGGDTGSAAWPAVATLAERVYDTLRLRLFTPERIHILTPSGSHDFDGDGTNDVAAAATCANLQAAICGWASTNATDRLTLYLLGEGAANAFRINAAEAVSTNALADWVHAFQATNPVPVTLILDFSGAGAFLPPLADRPDSPPVARIAIASAAAGREALFANNGTVSFTQYLLSGIIAGKTLGDAHTDARRAIRRISGGVRQRALLDDTRNGAANEKNVDGDVANATYLGSAFITGADAPTIGAVLPPQIVAPPGSAVTLWAEEVAGMYPISNVWCVVTPPDALPTDTLPIIPLAWNAASNRYEAATTDFTQPGAYVLTFYAQDTVGSLSAPMQSEILLADAYEPDDQAGQASLYTGASQLHTFLSADDVDWVRVYLVSNFIYEIETDPISDKLDTVIDFYREGAGGTLDLLDHVDEEGDDLGEYTGIDFPASGWYWVRLSPYASGTNSVGAYRFSIDIPAADGLSTLIVLGVDDVTTNALPAGSSAEVSGRSTQAFNGSKTVVFSGLTNGAYLVTVPVPDDFIPREDPNTPGQVQSLTNLYYANPRTVTVSGGWLLAGFELLSTVAVTSGVVRDAWTGAFLEDARLSFTAASGSLSGTVVTGNVMLTRYSTPWTSAADGGMPPDIVLGACDWDLAVSLAGYEPYALGGAISNAPAGSAFNLGTLFLVPTDSNTNAVADAWEDLYFPGGMDPDADDDGDGLDNRSEYLCGTSPTNTLSVLRFLDMQRTTNETYLAWSVAGGRGYQILSVTSLVDTATVVTNGPWEAAHGQTSQTWTDTASPLPATRFYRIRLCGE